LAWTGSAGWISGRGETPAALVVSADPTVPPGEEELRRFVRARPTGFKVPVYWHVVSELTHDAAGKPLRRRLPGHHLTGV